jgi:hypothetical protein
MPARCTLLVVEGWLDAEVCARLLKSSGFHRLTTRGALNEAERELVRLLPKSDPTEADLTKRSPIPLILANARQQTVVIRVAEGDAKVIGTLKADLITLGQGLPDAVGVLLDADGSLHSLKSSTAAERYSGFTQRWTSDVETKTLGIQWPNAPASTSTSSPRCGAFILPDNQSAGTMDKLVVEAGQAVYPELAQRAHDHVKTSGDLTELNLNDRKEFSKPFGQVKAIAAAMTAILKPGKTTLTSIQDHRWLEGDLTDRPLASALQKFLNDLIA